MTGVRGSPHNWVWARQSSQVSLRHPQQFRKAQCQGEGKMESRFNALMITASDIDCSVRFYRDLLGLDPVTVSPRWSEFKLTEDFNLGIHIV